VGGHRHTQEYDVYTVPAIDALIEQECNDLAALLSLDVPTCHQLLVCHEWKEEKLKSSIFASRARVLLGVGYAEDEGRGVKKAKQDANIDCPVCYDTVDGSTSVLLVGMGCTCVCRANIYWVGIVSVWAYVLPCVLA
jgi:hypothetical protein